MENNTQEEKQNFLRENILEKGYDTNKFIEFLKSKKGEEGEDISNWTMEDLKIIVKEFIALKDNKNIEKEEDENKNNNLGNIKTPLSNKSNNNNITNNNNNNNNTNSNEAFGQNEEDFGIVLREFEECQTSETTELSKYNNLEIIINSYKKVDKGIFSKSFISFLIVTNPLNLNVHRRYSDFDWLRERLSVLYNTNILPPLSKKGKIVEERKINRRMRDLEKFLKYLIKDPLIKNSQILFDFLSIESDEEFHKKKILYNKLKSAIEIKDFKSLNGKTRINVNNNKEQYLEYIRQNAAFNVNAFKNFEQNFFALRNETNIVINRLNSFSPMLDQLIKIGKKYYDDVATIESFKQIKFLFESWSNTLTSQNEFFFIDLKEYFKFLEGNFHHTKELVQIVENKKTNYYKISKSLIAKKIDLFKKQETGNWQLDLADINNLVSFYNDKNIAYKKICFKETNNVIKLKEKYGYYLNRMISEYERLRYINAIENKEKTIQLAKKQQEIFSEFFQKMGDIIGIMDGCEVENLKEGESVKFVNNDIDINENNENDINNQQQEENKKDNNKEKNENNDNSYED